MVDRPLRPAKDESYLLDEFDIMPIGQVDAVEQLINYIDDMELWVDQNITAQAVATMKAQVADLQTQLKEARDSAAQARSQREQQLEGTVRNLSNELAFAQVKLGGIQLILR